MAHGCNVCGKTRTKEIVERAGQSGSGCVAQLRRESAEALLRVCLTERQKSLASGDEICEKRMQIHLHGEIQRDVMLPCGTSYRHRIGKLRKVIAPSGGCGSAKRRALQVGLLQALARGANARAVASISDRSAVVSAR